MVKQYNTRIAPSPTGHAHIGTFRTALFCYLAARASDGIFMLRIDDTDTARNDEKAVEPIRDALTWLRMEPDHMIRQSDHIETYQCAAIELVRNGYATILSNGAIALKWQPDMPKEWVDNISGPAKVTQTNIDQIDGKLILLKGKAGKFAPTYQFASAFDDRDHHINYIIRGTDHISNTPKQLAIWWALNKSTDYFVDYPEWAHLGLIFKDGKKLSKRDGASSILEWRNQGYLPQTLLAFMLRLGWAPKVDNKENDMLTMDRAIEMFLTQGKMKNSSANMDTQKLAAFERKMRAKLGDHFPYEDERSKKMNARLAEFINRTKLDEPNFLAAPEEVHPLSMHGQHYINRIKNQVRYREIELPEPEVDDPAQRIAAPVAPDLNVLLGNVPPAPRPAWIIPRPGNALNEVVRQIREPNWFNGQPFAPLARNPDAAPVVQIRPQGAPIRRHDRPEQLNPGYQQQRNYQLQEDAARYRERLAAAEALRVNPGPVQEF